MNQQVDVLKKSLEMVDTFLEARENELATFKNFGIDTEPLEVLYKHFRELLQEMLAAPSPRAFHDMMFALSQQIAGVLIIISPASADQVMADMQGAHPSMDPSAFADLIKDINKHTNFKASEAPATGENPYVDPENDPDELLDMLPGLKGNVKKGGKSKKKKDKAEEASGKPADKQTKKSSSGDPFSDVYGKYESEE